MFRLLLPFNVHAVNIHINIHIFLLVHQLRLLLTLTFVICLVSVMRCMFNSEEFIYRMFEDCIGLFNSHYRSVSRQNLY